MYVDEGNYVHLEEIIVRRGCYSCGAFGSRYGFPKGEINCDTPDVYCPVDRLHAAQANGNWSQMLNRCCFDGTNHVIRDPELSGWQYDKNLRALDHQHWFIVGAGRDPSGDNGGHCYISPELPSVNARHYFVRFCNSRVNGNMYILFIAWGYTCPMRTHHHKTDSVETIGNVYPHAIKRMYILPFTLLLQNRTK
jgi:hypothetical protein